MMPIAIPPGVVRGATPNDFRGRWYDTNLVRWQNGVLTPIGGSEKIATTPFNTRIRNMHVWRNNVLTRFLVAASISKVYSEFGSGFVDITPDDLVTSATSLEAYGFGVGDYGMEEFGTPRSQPSVNLEVFPRFWTFDNWGEDLLAVSSADGRLFYYDVTNPAAKLTPVAEAPPSRAVLVTAERHVLLLQADGNPRRFAWSSREDYTDYNFASVTNTAGFLDLATQTALLRAVKVRGGVLIFSSSDVFVVQYIGLPFIYGQNWIGKTRPVTADAIVTDNGNAFWWAGDGFKMFDGAGIKSIDCPIWDYIQKTVNPETLRTHVHGSANGLFPEIWWFYPSGSSAICDRYVIYNYAENWWAIGRMPRSAMVAADADRFPYAVTESGYPVQMETGWTDLDGGIREVWAETAALALGAGDRGMDIRQGLPANGSGYDSMQFRFYTNRTPEGAEREFGPYRVRSDGYLDLRVSGRDVRMRIENTKDAEWSVGEVRLDIVPGAGR